ncbi:MAG: Rmf/CrpP family protein [Bacteroidota bacterium]
MKKQVAYAEGKSAFVDGKRRYSNPYRWRNRDLASIWVNGWDQARKDRDAKEKSAG